MVRALLVGLGGFVGSVLRYLLSEIERLSEDLPIIIEIVDVRAKLEEFLALIDHAIVEGLATLEKAHVHFYRAGGGIDLP